MSVFDCFLFCHELELLEVRLRTCYEHVDKFLLIEADHTHINNPKPLYFEENKQRYDFAKDKIIHIKLHGPWIDEKPNREVSDDYRGEYKMRQKLYDEARAYSEPDDIIMLSDLDEFPSLESIEHLKKSELKKPLLLKQDLYCYNITFPMYRKWNGTIAFRSKNKLMDAEKLRNYRTIMDHFDGGWHFSYFMSPEQMIQKLQSFAHANHYGVGDYVRMDLIRHHMKYKQHLLGKKTGQDIPSQLPEYIIKEMARFPLFMGET